MKAQNQPEHAELLDQLRVALLQAEAAAVNLSQFYDEVGNQVWRTMRFREFGEFNSKSERFETVQAWEAEATEFHVFDKEYRE